MTRINEEKLEFWNQNTEHNLRADREKEEQMKDDKK